VFERRYCVDPSGENWAVTRVVRRSVQRIRSDRDRARRGEQDRSLVCDTVGPARASIVPANDDLPLDAWQGSDSALEPAVGNRRLAAKQEAVGGEPGGYPRRGALVAALASLWPSVFLRRTSASQISSASVFRALTFASQIFK
jgi:hypothetical protein